LEFVTSACYFYNNNRTAVSIDFSWANNTLFLMKNKDDLSEHLKIAGIRQIIFATDNELNLCSLSATWPKDPPVYYTWGTLLDLSQFESSAILKSTVPFLKDLNLTARILNNKIVNIEWTFADG
jgi:hypothetical protein